MRIRLVSVAAACLFSAVPAVADWVDLKDGTSLRGVDLEDRGKKKLLTLEDGKVVSFPAEWVSAVRRSQPGERVEFRGEQVTLREKVRRIREEEAARRKASLADLEKWAAAGREAGEARERFLQLPAGEQERILEDGLASGRTRAARILAARELSSRKTARSVHALTRGAIEDANTAVRSECLRSLAAFEDPTLGERFIPFLASSSDEHRLHAARALEALPARKAVPALIDTARKAWTRFGRAFIFQGESRAYIRDYNLVSGGTGFSLIEVADPEVDTVSTGVVLDVKVRKVEIEARVAALRKITGQDHGRDLGKWREWWMAQPREESEEK